MTRLIAYVLIAFCLFLAACLTTDFSSNPFFQTVTVPDAFDALAVSLAGFDVTINLPRPWNDLDWINGRPVMYFGLLPAIPRIIANRITPENYGLWTPLSCLFACLLALLAATKSFSLVLDANEKLTQRLRLTLLAAAIMAVGLGSPLFYLSCWANIWHESMLWGLAFSLWGIYGAVNYLEHKDFSSIMVLSSATALTLLSRPTFALPLFPALALMALHYTVVTSRASGRSILRIAPSAALALIPALTGLAIQAWYNYMRFGSVINLLSGLNNKGDGFSIFTIDRLAITAQMYFASFPDQLLTSFPFFMPLPTRFIVPALASLYPEHADWLLANGCDPVFPFSLSTCWLLLVLPVGILLMCRDKERRPIGICITLFLFSQWVLILSYYYVANRFQAEFLPLGVFALCMTLKYMAAPKTFSRLLLVLSPAIISICVTLLSVWALKSRTDCYLTRDQGFYQGLPGAIRQEYQPWLDALKEEYDAWRLLFGTTKTR